MRIATMLAAACLVAGLGLGSVGDARAQAHPNLAPGFSHLAKSAKVLLLPVDVELFSMSAGGVNEPRADWTAAAQTHMKAALSSKAGQLGLRVSPIDESAADEFSEPIALHAAVARSIALHHSLGGAWALPTKEGRLDWSFGDAMQSLRSKTEAQYGLFVWVRDSYASAERKLAMVGLALIGVGLTGGSQVGYASLVDLNSGQVMWFNRLARATGDLREAASATESIEALLAGFPKVQ